MFLATEESVLETSKISGARGFPAPAIPRHLHARRTRHPAARLVLTLRCVCSSGCATDHGDPQPLQAVLQPGRNLRLSAGGRHGLLPLCAQRRLHPASFPRPLQLHQRRVRQRHVRTPQIVRTPHKRCKSRIRSRTAPLYCANPPPPSNVLHFPTYPPPTILRAID